MPGVIVVGAGVAGAACARELTRHHVDVRVVERGRAPGGRLASPAMHGRRVDLGAAYFTARDHPFAAVVDGWADAGLARRWTNTFDVAGPGGMSDATSGPMRWGAPDGLRSLSRDLLAGLDVRLGAPVETVDVENVTVDGEAADAVVLAMPDPQAARLVPVADGTTFDPVIAVAAGWSQRRWPFADACFVHDDPDLTFVADDGARRGDAAPVLVAHTSAPLAERHLDDPDGAVAPVLAALHRLFGVDMSPVWTHAHRWTFAKPSGQHDESFGTVNDRILLAGDSWCPDGKPRVESAWLSGTAAARALLARR